ncbi:MAG: hypothetical protein P8Y60_15100 [Calditrichota bacterium]
MPGILGAVHGLCSMRVAGFHRWRKPDRVPVIRHLMTTGERSVLKTDWIEGAGIRSPDAIRRLCVPEGM